MAGHAFLASPSSIHVKDFSISPASGRGRFSSIRIKLWELFKSFQNVELEIAPLVRNEQYGNRSEGLDN